MSSGLRILTFGWLVLALDARDARAAEGGYSNYIPGTQGDFAVAVAPDSGLTLRNDAYYYSADESRAALQGQVRVDLDVAFAMNLLTLREMVSSLRLLDGKAKSRVPEALF